MPPSFQRTPRTWLLYLIFAIFGFVVNAFGPLIPFLKAELALSYTVSSLLFSAFAAGIILTGLVGHLAAARLGRARMLWLGLFGMCLGILGLTAARSAWATVGISFFTGCLGALLPSLVSASLADEHGEQRAAALSESNLIAAVSSAAAPLAVGWFSYTWLGWRFALTLPLAAGLALWLWKGRQVALEGHAAGPTVESSSGQKLPAVYWAFWVGMVMAVAVEYCMLFWCADYLEHVAGLPKSLAAQAGSLFLAGMILGRLVGSRAALRFNAYQIVLASIVLAALGFGLFWSAAAAWAPVVGLFVTGLGVANQFPLILALAIGSAGGNTVQASTRASLASGLAIFALPLALGRLADAVGIRLAYGVVGALLVIAFVIIQQLMPKSQKH